jgi:hypothetical protein
MVINALLSALVNLVLFFVLPFVLVGALFAGWLRIRSGSIVGPWLMHAAAYITVALSVAVRSAS